MYSVLKKVLEYEQKKVLQGRKKKYCKVAKKSTAVLVHVLVRVV